MQPWVKPGFSPALPKLCCKDPADQAAMSPLRARALFHAGGNETDTHKSPWDGKLGDAVVLIYCWICFNNTEHWMGVPNPSFRSLLRQSSTLYLSAISYKPAIRRTCRTGWRR